MHNISSELQRLLTYFMKVTKLRPECAASTIGSVVKLKGQPGTENTRISGQKHTKDLYMPQPVAYCTFYLDA